MRSPKRRRLLGVLGVLSLLVGFLPGLAASAVADAPEGAAAPSVELDRLLKLPDSLEYDVEKRGGMTRGEWRGRFREARSEIERAEEELRAAQLKLEGVAQGDAGWKFNPPGFGGAVSENPIDFGIRQEIKRAREELTRAQRQLRSLEVEANLAGAPSEWRE